MSVDTNKPFVSYDPDSDVLYIVTERGEEEEFVEITSGVNVELDPKGQVIGIEILSASKFLSSVIEQLHQKQTQLAS